MQIAEIRALTNKKYEILAELERARATIVKEITDLDDCKVSRFREILESYEAIEKRIDSKLKEIEANNAAIGKYAESTIADIKSDLAYLDSVRTQFDEIVTEFKKLENMSVSSRIQVLERKLLTIGDISNRTENLESKTFDLELTQGLHKVKLDNQLAEIEKINTRIQTAYNIPTLTQEQKDEIRELAKAYRTGRANVIYDFTPIRNIYADKTTAYNADGRARVNCGLFCQLVWGGISLDTFADKADTYDGTIEKEFDWGYYFQFPNRSAYGITKSDGVSLNGFRKPFEDTYNGSYSWNTYYTGTSAREDGQSFYNYMNVSDMAHELYMKGCEIPFACADVGDIIFYNTDMLWDGDDDNFQRFVFRNITHGAIISAIDHSKGTISVTEATDVMGTNYSILASSTTSPENPTRLHAISMHNNICMVCRHPYAFGFAPNVPDKFTAI